MGNDLGHTNPLFNIHCAYSVKVSGHLRKKFTLQICACANVECPLKESNLDFSMADQ